MFVSPLRIGTLDERHKMHRVHVNRSIYTNNDSYIKLIDPITRNLRDFARSDCYFDHFAG